VKALPLLLSLAVSGKAHRSSNDAGQRVPKLKRTVPVRA